MPKKGKVLLVLDGCIPKENIGKKDNEEEIEIPKQYRETEVLIESENVIGNQDDSEQAGLQKDTNVKIHIYAETYCPKFWTNWKV